jgi:hypothetical protein
MIQMQHRHLNHEKYTLAAIDDVIERGKRMDWAEFRRAALADRSIMEGVLHIAQTYGQDPYAQRYRFWKHYAEEHIKNSRHRGSNRKLA